MISLRDFHRARIHQSPVFDSTTGFGGDGVEGTYTAPTELDGALWNIFSFKGCISTGPFTPDQLTLHVGPGKRFTDHCLTRGIDDSFRYLFTPEWLERIANQSDYDTLWNMLDGKPYKTEWRLHDGGHRAIGGDMTGFYSSPNGTFISKRVHHYSY
jgi:tyrosinase